MTDSAAPGREWANSSRIESDSSLSDIQSLFDSRDELISAAFVLSLDEPIGLVIDIANSGIAADTASVESTSPESVLIIHVE